MKIKFHFITHFLKSILNLKKNMLTYRTIINNSNAERSSKVYYDKNNNIINVLSGKIDHIFAVGGEKVRQCANTNYRI